MPILLLPSRRLHPRSGLPGRQRHGDARLRHCASAPPSCLQCIGFRMLLTESGSPIGTAERPAERLPAVSNKLTRRTASKKEMTKKTSQLSSTRTTRAIDPSLQKPNCDRPMYFRCLDGSEYDRGEWVFVKSPGKTRHRGVCRRWRPDSLCLSRSNAHFRKRTTCVASCEERREKRCLQLVTEDLLRNCTGTGESSRHGHYWYYDRVQRTCLAWSPDYVCADAAFKSAGQCKNACLRRRTVFD
ncbi:unnamed protein product [Ixodes hexagonus]